MNKDDGITITHIKYKPLNLFISGWSIFDCLSVFSKVHYLVLILQKIKE